MCDFRDQRVVGVGVSEQGADGEQDLADGEGRTPLVLQDVQADGAVRVDVRVVNARDEVDLGRLEGVVRRELNVKGKDATLEGTVLRAHDSGHPVKEIILSRRPCRAIRRRITLQIQQFLLNSLLSHTFITP